TVGLGCWQPVNNREKSNMLMEV
ncbi:uncharacterized protein METZ01_LOCUS437698, partial [marine metagenome]